MASYFLNADLEIVSSAPIDLLLAEIGERAYLFGGAAQIVDGAFVATYEIDTPALEKNPENLSVAFCDLIDSLSITSKEQWLKASSRFFGLWIRHHS